MILALTQGGQFVSTIDSTFSFFLQFAQVWPGGTPLRWGVYAAAALTAINVGLAVRDREPLTLTQRVDLFLLANLAFYLLWTLLAVGNKAPQYGGNIYFFVLPLAARGWVLLGGAAARMAGRPIVEPAFAAVAVVVILATSTQTSDYFRVNPFTLDGPRVVRDDVRAELAALVPKDQPVLLAPTAYPYLHDRPFVSQMRLVAERFLKPDLSLGFFDLLDEHLSQRADYDLAALTPEDLQAGLRARPPVIVASKTGYGYGDKFFDARVWEPDYRVAGSVLINRALVNEEPIDIPERSTDITILVRRDLAPRYATERGLAWNTLRQGRHAAVLLQDPNVTPVPLADTTEWAVLPEAAREQILRGYLDAHNWFALAAARRDEAFAGLYGAVDAQLADPATSAMRTVDQAVALAMLDPALTRYWR